MNRNYAIDYIKFFAILGVVIIHSGISQSQTGFYLNTLSRFGVPFFFIAAGYLFGNKVIKHSSPTGYLKKYIIKLTKIYVSWQLIYLIYDLCMFIVQSYINGVNLKQELIHYFEKITVLNFFYYGDGITGGYHLWFLPALIWSIVILYAFFKLKKINLLLILSFSLHLIGLFGQSYSGFYNLPINTRDTVFFGLFYITLGFFFSSNLKDIKLKLGSKKLYFLALIGFSVIQIFERSILVNEFKGNSGNYFISTIFVTLTLFIMVLNNPNIGKNSFIAKVGANSLGIYVIHLIFIKMTQTILSFFSLTNITQSFGWIILYPLFIFIISYIAYNFIQFLKNLFLTKVIKSRFGRSAKV